MTPPDQLWQIVDRIDRYIVDSYFKMAVDAAGFAGIAHMRDDLPLVNLIAFLNKQLTAMPIISDISVIMLNLHQKPVAVIPVGQNDLTAVGGNNILTIGTRDVDALMV